MGLLHRLCQVATTETPLLRRAVRLSAATVGWNLAVGVAAIATAVATGGLSLIGFGFNAVLDSSVSVLLIWRFRIAQRGHDEHAERLERRALTMAAGAFCLVAAYLFVRALSSLISGHHGESSGFGIAEACASLVVLPYLATTKFRVAGQLGSRALRADALLTTSGVALAAITLVGLILQSALGWWWADPVAALAISAFLVWGGSQAWRDRQL
jgi:divalent metal cation (Fe/Co/Zn/Cd) transporter